MKLKKEIVLTALITAVITGTVAVTAVSLTAKDIGFTSTTEGWEVTNVEDAVNDLYQSSNKQLSFSFTSASPTGTALRVYQFSNYRYFKVVAANCSVNSGTYKMAMYDKDWTTNVNVELNTQYTVADYSQLYLYSNSESYWCEAYLQFYN